MGKCCGKAKDANPLPPPGEFYLHIVEFDKIIPIQYSPTLRVSTVLKMIEYEVEGCQLFKDNELISEYNAPFSALGIQQNDTIRVVKPKEKTPVRKEPSILMNSLEEIAEEETTNRREIGTILPMRPGNMRRRRNEQPASTLWRAALAEYNKTNLKYEPDISAQSNYTFDKSILEKNVPRNLPMAFRPIESAIMDSDESHTMDRIPNIESAAHPIDYFRDLQGPFSVLKQF